MVPDMNLEARVSALEDVVPALRAETRGWAAFAVSAHGRALMAGEMLTHIYEEVRHTRAELAQLTEKVDGHTATLAQHTVTLAQHTATLAQLTETVDGHTATLAQHTATLAQLTETVDGHTAMLREILRRLPEPA
jgi:ABC-type transporter Mla subunit MlaD